MNEVDMSEVASRRGGSIGRSLRVVASFASVGLVLGALWALTAPVEHVAAVGDGRAIVLTGESDHRFDALALFLCITAAAGVVATVGVWSVVSDRGPRLAVDTVVGAFAGSAVAAGVGLAVGALRYASAEGAARGDVVGLAPGMSTPLALLAQPLAAAVTIVLIAALSASDDLRRGDTVEASDESMSSS
ncbi:hypothetical protein ASG56_00395 [Rhodococcus sp. Leaf7]|uniref:DUF2567 domain-containing protein n=1 Tax=unclassified Rhodococcus (in: high G+C Gram-positive bacteria) TaxID=192944 RepID=UPI00069907F6|nr:MULTISPECIES: DUF2567 domain-containing protein [unclassified Rhodococcus (in: high G+C Gram-positive bacteria)]KQU06220.1 hypothetical protein ASG56_00395 [Rhodococcus sp. Leaf7]KQU41736.1 hypothetical protein ASG64_00395 [Rhodococcus sp. Leaf247]